MGVSVREKVKGSGVFWIFINHKGIRKSKKVGDRGVALEVAKKIEAKMVLDEFNLDQPKESNVPKFKDYALIWLENYIKGLRKESTYNRYKQVLNDYIFPVIGNIEIDRITRGQIRDMLFGISKKGLSKSSVSLARDVVSGPLNYAIDDELIKYNPVSGSLKRMGLTRDRSAHVDPLNKEEVALFLETCRKYFSAYEIFFLCDFRTGLRLGEILALKWGDIDWNSKFISVKRSYKIGKFSSTKTGRSRNVDMSGQLYQAMKQLLTKRKKEALRSGQEIVEIIFHRDGKPMEQNYIRRIFKRILKKAGLREIRIHDIRHTFASLLLSDGASPVYVKEQLGHSSIEMTVDVYGKWIKTDENKGIVDNLDTPPKSSTQSAPYLHPIKTKKP